MKIFAIVTIVVIMSMLLLPIIPANTFEDEPNPEFEVSLWTCLGNGFRADNIEIAVKNVGEGTAHNITLTDITIDGRVIYNNRKTEWNRDIEPGSTLIDCPRSLFFGFGKFTVTMTVTCDEGINGTGTGNGIIIGFLIFVP